MDEKKVTVTGEEADAGQQSQHNNITDNARFKFHITNNSIMNL
jgi:hypothetical protein